MEPRDLRLEERVRVLTGVYAGREGKVRGFASGGRYSIELESRLTPDGHENPAWEVHYRHELEYLPLPAPALGPSVRVRITAGVEAGRLGIIRSIAQGASGEPLYRVRYEERNVRNASGHPVLSAVYPAESLETIGSYREPWSDDMRAALLDCPCPATDDGLHRLHLSTGSAEGDRLLHVNCDYCTGSLTLKAEVVLALLLGDAISHGRLEGLPPFSSERPRALKR
jgi:hypothetical protein